MIRSILHLELLLGSRRGRLTAFRRLYAGWLIVQFFFLYLAYLSQARQTGPSLFAGECIQQLIWQQLILVCLVTPAFVAGAITDEKSRGTLEFLLTADLTATDIVVGKLLGRMLQVLALTLVGLPLLAFVGPFADLDLGMVLALLGLTVGPAFALSAASLLASVWCRHTRDAVLSVYTLAIAGFVVVNAVGGVLDDLNPLHVLEPAWDRFDQPRDAGEVGRRLLLASLAWGTIGAICLVLAVLRLRAACVRQLEADGSKKTRFWWARLDAVWDNPLLWKERHVHGLAPLPWLRQLPTWLGIVVVFTATALHSQTLTGAEDFAMQALVVLLVASVLVGIRCSGAVTGERERQTWEALLLTPLLIRQLIDDKLRGIVGASYPYLAAYVVPAIVAAGRESLAALGWTLLGLPATLLAMHFVGAAGIWCSVRCKSSWRSLLGTLGIGYGIGSLLFVFAAPVITIAAFFLAELLDYLSFGTYRGPRFQNMDVLVYVLFALGQGFLFWKLSRIFIRKAQQTVAARERTPYWKSGVNCVPAVERHLQEWGSVRG